MRELKTEEARILLSKLVKFKGKKLVNFLKINFFSFLVFKIQKKRIFFSSLSLYSRIFNFSKKRIGSFGICVGRFSHSKKLKFLIPLLNMLLKYKGLFSAFLKTEGEKSFLFGKHVEKKNVSKLSKNVFKNDGIVLFNKNKIAIGFGEALKSIVFIPKLDLRRILFVNQGDTGLYVRSV